MGCDIHFYVEHRELELRQKALISCEEYVDDAPWSTDLQPNPYFDHRDPESHFNSRLWIPTWYSNRDYSLFYRLAGVRGPYEFEPLSESRGLPEDISSDMQRESDGWGTDGHSHSYFTLTELLAVDWDLGGGVYWTDFILTIAAMQELALMNCGGDTDRVRCVFWFDN